MVIKSEDEMRSARRQKIRGLVLGYPECCADTFANNFDEISQDSTFDGTGFRPCKTCAERKTTEQLREEIAKNRLVPLPFLDDYSQHYLNGYYREPEDLAHDLIDHRASLETLREVTNLWLPIVREMRCYRIEDTKRRGWYFFTDRFADRTVIMTDGSGNCDAMYLLKHWMRQANLVTDPVKVAKLLAECPQLLNNKDFKLNTEAIATAEANTAVGFIKPLDSFLNYHFY